MRRRLALVALATTALVVLSVLLPLGVAVRTIARDRAVRDGELQAQGLVPVLAVVHDRASVQRAIALSQARGTAELSVVLPDRTVVGVPLLDLRLLDAPRRGRAVNVTSNGGVEVLTPVDGTDGSRSIIRVRVSGGALTRGVASAWLILALLGVAMLLIAVAVADRLARSIVRSVRHVEQVTQRLQAGELSARAIPDGPPEVQAVALTLNQLAGRITELLQNERETMADLSHRLRTPIAALRLEADSLKDPVEAERVTSGVDEIACAVDQLIGQARRSAPAGPSTCDLVEVVRDRCAFWAVLAEEEHRRFDTVIRGDPIIVTIGAEELAACVDTLLGNVFAHTPEGTAFRVTVDDYALAIEDDGPGLADGPVAVRGRSGGGSTGLGLDIARTTAEHLGGRLHLGSGTLGGARVEIRFGASDQYDRPT